MWVGGSRKLHCQSLQTGQGAGCAGGLVVRQSERQGRLWPRGRGLACGAWEQKERWERRKGAETGEKQDIK